MSSVPLTSAPSRHQANGTRPDVLAHGPNGNCGMCPRVHSFATLLGSGSRSMPPSSGVTPVSGRMLAPCVTTTSVPVPSNPPRSRAPPLSILRRGHVA